MNYNKADFIASYGISSQLPESDRPELSFSGRSNVGKSSLINALAVRKKLAKVSATPGKTRSINFYRVQPHNFFLVGLGPGRLFRLGGGFFGREDIGLHCEGDGASGVRKGQLEVPRQTAERPAVGVDEERRPQPVGEAARLSVQGLPRPGGEEGGGFGEGVGRPANAQRDRQDQLILRPGEGHIQKPHLLAPHLGGMDRGESGVEIGRAHV